MDKELLELKLKRILGTVLEKNGQYGNTASKAGKIMNILMEDKRDRTFELLIVRILDKLGRISQGHLEDSFEDIIGYCLIGLDLKEKQNEYIIGRKNENSNNS